MEEVYHTPQEAIQKIISNNSSSFKWFNVENDFCKFQIGGRSNKGMELKLDIPNYAKDGDIIWNGNGTWTNDFSITYGTPIHSNDGIEVSSPDQLTRLMLTDLRLIKLKKTPVYETVISHHNVELILPWDGMEKSDIELYKDLGVF